MTKEQRDGIERLMREHLKREADDTLLKELLDRERIMGKVLADWRLEFTLGQEDAAYRRLLQDGDEWIAEVLAAIDRNEAIAVFVKNPPRGPAN